MLRPLNVSIPGISGVRGWNRNPVAATMNCVLSVSPPANATRHNWACSSYQTPSAVVWNRMRGARRSYRPHAWRSASTPRPAQTGATSRGWLEPVGIRGQRLIDGQDVVVAQPFELDRPVDSAETRPCDDRVELARSHDLQTVPHRSILPERLSADNARANVR